MIRAIAATESVYAQPGQAEPDHRLQKIIAEESAWYAQPKAERMNYAGEYVALLDGQVVDHDPNQDLLDRRIYRTWETQRS